jgi:hypothetical protein
MFAKRRRNLFKMDPALIGQLNKFTSTPACETPPTPTRSICSRPAQWSAKASRCRSFTCRQELRKIFLSFGHPAGRPPRVGSFPMSSRTLQPRSNSSRSGKRLSSERTGKEIIVVCAGIKHYWSAHRYLVFQKAPSKPVAK